MNAGAPVPQWLSNLTPIGMLLVVIAVVLWRMPRVDLGHSPAFRKRRLLNWIPLGLTYALLYFGRYNLAAINSELESLKVLSKAQFGTIDGIGSVVYGVAFLLNGPLTDKWGGRVTILIAAAGSMLMNGVMAVIVYAFSSQTMSGESFLTWLTVAFAANMYFQSFGAVSIVKVNAPWFHVRERGVLGGLFGILISLGIFLPYEYCPLILKHVTLSAVFVIPAVLLAVAFVAAFLVIRDSPADAGYADFETGDASYSDEAKPSLLLIARRMFAQRVMWIIVAIEFCSGFLRQAVMKWGRSYAKDVGVLSEFVFSKWGLITCVAGITGGIFAGFISDRVFGSRRGPVTSVLYGGLLGGAAVAYFALGTSALSWSVAFMSLCVIGVHGMLSGTASMDFGGKKGAGIATGIIDGFVYLGSATQAFIFGRILPKGEIAKSPDAWGPWPLTMLPVALIGLFLASRLWNARPPSKHSALH
jgi:MFS transporter, OPA family, glycerol-3-phosphate transporter